MPLSDANVVQENSGINSNVTSHTVSLGSATTAGNVVIIFFYTQGAVPGPPTGFTYDIGTAGAIYVHHKAAVAGETSWTVTTTIANDSCWYVVEMSNVDVVDPVDVTSSGSGSISNGGTISTGTTAQNAALSAVAFAAFGSSKAAGDTASWSGYTNGFTELADVASATTNPSHFAIASKYIDGATQTFESTATRATTGAAGNADSLMIVFRAADSPIFAPLSAFTGFGFGTPGGLGNTALSNPIGPQFGISGTIVTNYDVAAGYARNGSYGLRLVHSASSNFISVGQFTTSLFAIGLNVRVVSATGTVVVAWIDGPSTSDLKLVYNASTTKFGLQWASGTVSYESGTTALNTWRWIDIRAAFNSDVFHADWRIETGTNTYTAQTSPADLTGQSASPAVFYLGYNVSQTMTANYDDVILSKYYAAYPLGPHHVDLLTVDTGGTPTVSGTTANFNVFTANGTLAAWNATNARNAVDEVPPTISASADGVVQVTTAASDYMEFPMANPTVAADEAIRAVRFMAPTWGGTGTGTGTLGLRVYDGVTETVIDAGVSAYDGDSLTAVSATYPIWRQGTVSIPSGGWSPTRANALVSRVGYSSDATPDMGVSALYLEVAIGKATVVRQVTIEDPMSATVDLSLHPDSSASVSYVVTNNDAGRSVNFNYSVSGTPQTPVTVMPGTNTTVQVNADNFGDISDLSLEPQ